MASRKYSFDFAEKKNILHWKLENQHGFESSHHRRNKYKMQKLKKKKNLVFKKYLPKKRTTNKVIMLMLQMSSHSLKKLSLQGLQLALDKFG